MASLSLAGAMKSRWSSTAVVTLSMYLRQGSQSKKRTDDAIIFMSNTRFKAK
jgi:hypothetical protein